MASRKFFSALIMAALVLGLLSACASKQQAVSEQSPAATEEAKKAAAAQAAQQEALKQQEIAKAAERAAAEKKAAEEAAKAAAATTESKQPKGEAEPPVVPPRATAGAAVEGNLKRVHFEFDKYNITPEAAETLKANRDYLMSHPNTRILIEGHCDERGTVDYNLALGERRANAVRRFLQDLRIDPKRIDIISYGEERPLDPAANEDAWAKNRRADFREL